MRRGITDPTEISGLHKGRLYLPHLQKYMPGCLEKRSRRQNMCLFLILESDMREELRVKN